MHGQIEHRAAVIREIKLALAIGDVDPVRKKEVGANQHIDIVAADSTDAKASILDLFVSDLEACKRRDPGVNHTLADTALNSTVRDARSTGFYAESLRYPHTQ